MSEILERIRAGLEEIGDCLEWAGPMGTGRRNTSQPVVRVYNPEKRYCEKLPVRRLLWEAEHGPVPAGQIVYSICPHGTSRCCTHMVIGIRGAAHRFRARHGFAKKTPAMRAGSTRGARNRVNVKHSIEQARAVRELAQDGIPDALIGWATGVSPSMVADIRSGKAWKEQVAASSVFEWRPA